MRRIGLIAGLHTEATVRYLRQFDEQATDRFGAASPVGVFVNSINGRAFESAMKCQDAAQVHRICVEAAQQCAAAGAEALLLGNSQLHVGADAIRKSVGVPLLDLVDATLSVERIRRAFAQPTPDLVEGEPLRRSPRERAADPGVSDAEKIIALLRQRGPTSPREIGAAMNMSRASIYRQLSILESAGQVAVTGNTRSVKYSVA